MPQTETNKSKFTCVLIKKDLVRNKKLFTKAMAATEAKVDRAGLCIVARKYVDLSVPMPDKKTLCEHFYAVHEDKHFFKDLMKQQSGLVYALLLAATKKNVDAVGAGRKIIGSTDPDEDRKNGKNTLRAQFGESKARNGFHGSDSEESASYEANLLWSPEVVENYLSEYLQPV